MNRKYKPPHPAGPLPAGGGALLYVYTVVEASARDALTDLPLPPALGEGLRLVEHARLAAVVEPVDASRFDEEPLRARLEDLDKLAALARAHHGVVGAVGARTTTVPVQLATVCRGEEGVRRLLEEAHQRIRDALERIAGAQEWGVKLYADPDAAAPDCARAPVPPPVPPPAPSPGAGPAGGSAGRDYLRRRLSDRRARETEDARAARTAEALHEELSRRAKAAVLHPPQPAGLSGATGRNVLNAAYLVALHARESFVAALPAADALPTGLRLEVTGPWVPYSFTASGRGADPSP
ncbi:GvpL/GvpF family gas vesicle protein [Streptomyces sp. RerS4]|uniref:GvpL/GvpF family gas vesicle protein n=1 Tax=Streptomyces sp. RerS4 TaxID=2942449 RepID=UPI00201C86F0|nr:GvpL/GvpF family gas vesicle protein [Streptomyces sp. RerS4]UQW99338.1 GvpL/GvpF family gas vesicle protein [Streptomyces sp. RerS4]